MVDAEVKLWSKVEDQNEGQESDDVEKMSKGKGETSVSFCSSRERFSSQAKPKEVKNEG
jgi:hypothetical protein